MKRIIIAILLFCTAAYAVNRYYNPILLKERNEIRFEDTSGGEYIGLRAPSAVTSSFTFDLPDGDGTAGQAILTNGSGVLEWGEAGGGGGSKNYISTANSKVEDGITGWTEFDDASAYVDGTGGTAANLTASNFSSTGLEGSKVLRIAITTGAQYEGVSVVTDTIDGADFGRTLHGSFEVDATDIGYSTGDLLVKAYCTTDAVNGASVRPVSSGEEIENRKYKHQFTVLPSSDCSEIRISLMVDNNGVGWTVDLDDFKLGPDSPVPGFISHGWKALSSPSWTNFSIGNGTENIEYRRSGDTMWIRGEVAMGSTSNVSGTVELDIPEGETVNDLSNSLADGWAHFFDNGSGANNTTGSAFISGNSIRFLADGQVSSMNASTPFTWANGDRLSFVAQLPIVGWKDSASLSTTEVLFQTASANMSLSAAQNITTTDETTIELDVSNIDKFNGVDTGNNKYVIPKDGDYLLMAQAFYSGTTAGDTMRLMIKKNGSTYLNDARYEVPAGANNQTLQAISMDSLQKGDEITITARSQTDTSYNILSDASSRGKITGLTVLRWPDYSTFSQYMVNDLVEAIGAQASYSITADQYGDLDSIDLTPGEWDITATAVYISSGTTTTDRVFIGLGTGSGTTAPNLGGSAQSALNRVGESMDNTTGQKKVLNLSFMGYQVTDATTVYFKAFAETSTTNLQVAYKIQARKIK